jgi:hypothetical protein
MGACDHRPSQPTTRATPAPDPSIPLTPLGKSIVGLQTRFIADANITPLLLDRSGETFVGAERIGACDSRTLQPYANNHIQNHH